mgnify:CR=1 FL=1
MLKKSLCYLSLLLILGSLWPLRPITATNQGYGEPGVWEDLDLRGGFAQALALSPNFPTDNLVLAGEYQTYRHPMLQFGIGIRRSTNGGLNWHPTAIAPPDDALSSTLAVHDFAFSPTFAADQTVFAATWAGLFRSTDSGQTWNIITGTGQWLGSVAVAPDFAASGHLMAGDGYFGSTVSVSADGGQSWTAHQGVAAGSDIAYSPGFATDGIAFTAGNGVHLTTNRGISWTQILTGGVSALAVSPQFATDTTIFAAGRDGVYISTDGGASWISHTIAIDVTWLQALAISPAFDADGALFAGNEQGLYRSTDRGEHWETIDTYPGPNVRALALAPTWPTTPTLLVGSTNGVYRSDDGGITWYQGAGLAPLAITQLVHGPDPHLLTAATTSHGVYQSSDLGATWRFAGLAGPTGVRYVALSPDYSHDQTMLANVPAYAGFNLYRTTDGGITWTLLTSSDYPGEGLAFSPAFPDDDVVYATGQHGKVLRSTDLGDTWEPVGAPPEGTGSLGAWHVALPPTYPTDGTLFAGGSGFWRLPPGAEVWQLAATELRTDTQVTSLAVSPNYAVDQTLFATAQRNEPDFSITSGIYRSTDGGANWVRLTVGLPPADATSRLERVAFSPDYATDHTVYASTETQLYRSRDGGDRWTAIDVPPGLFPLQDVVGGMEGSVYVGGKTGVQRYTTTAWNILADGGFETGTGWTLPETAHPAGYTSSPVYSGAQALRVGIDEGPNVESYSSARQTVTIPANMASATFFCQVWPVTGERVLAQHARLFTPHTPDAPVAGNAPAAGDAQYLLIMDGTTTLETLFWELTNAANWQLRTFDLSAYRGQTITLHFGVYNDGAGGITALYVDDAALVVSDSDPITYTLEINIVGEGTVTRAPSAAAYISGTSVLLTAEPAVGWHFANWSGDLEGDALAGTVVMDAHKVITATFMQNEYTLDVAVEPEGSGTVTVDPAQAVYHHGDAVTLTATPATGWVFDGWSGALTGSANPATLLVDGDKSVVATFTPEVSVTPSALNVTLREGETAVRSITVSNHSDVDLLWQLVMEAEVGWLRLDWQTTIGLPVITPPGGTGDSTTFFDATGLGPGIYTTTLTVSSDHPIHPRIDIPVRLTVGYKLFLPLVMRSSN